MDATEFRIEPGLTGIVGPNGCGKSNLLEALRWVMGATSAKAMRGAGMDDVIFAGSDRRPGRHWAEVTLSIDNGDLKAPHPFTDQPVLDVSRRIDRGAGSTYRVNGREVRARDVQLLFADASTGANSPALVRQGQISELIASKPQNRRRILEEAGGISGLHTRRHEAELRLKAAESNLSRLDDLARELDQALGRLKREARQAEKYKKLSAEIRALQGAILLARLKEAEARLLAEDQALNHARLLVETTTRLATQAQVQALAAEDALPHLRDEDLIAQGVLNQLILELDRLDMAMNQAKDTLARAEQDDKRVQTDLLREVTTGKDAKDQVERLQSQLAKLEQDILAAPERTPELRAALLEAEQGRAKAEHQALEAAGQLAAEEAKAKAHAQQAAHETQRLAAAKTRLERARQALEQALTERASLGDIKDPRLEKARLDLKELDAQLSKARQDLEEAEAKRSLLIPKEAKARQDLRHIEDRLGRLQTEARGLAQLLVTPTRPGTYQPALEQITVEKGYEAALAAALGEDVNGALTSQAPSFWAGANGSDAAWPEGVIPLAPHVSAPPQLAARLSMIGITTADLALNLMDHIPTGMRLVTLDGDLFRWDGFVSRAKAPGPTALRLAQKRRHEDLEVEIDALRPEFDRARKAETEAKQALLALEAALGGLRARPQQLDRQVMQSRANLEQLDREQARKEARAQALAESFKSLEVSLSEAEDGLKLQQEAIKALGPQPSAEQISRLKDRLSSARTDSQKGRDQVAMAQARLDQDQRDQAARLNRKLNLERDLKDWIRRGDTHESRLLALQAEYVRAREVLVQARGLPDSFEDRAQDLKLRHLAAKARKETALQDLTLAIETQKAADQALRRAESDAAKARESRAATEARLEAAKQRLEETKTTIQDQTRDSVDALIARMSQNAIAVPAEISGAESLLFALERERDQLGPVNLRAEDEVTAHMGRMDQLLLEREDLISAIAKLREAIDELNAEGRERLVAAFDIINEHFKSLFVALFGGGEAELKLVESEDPLEAGLEIYACPPGKRLTSMSLMSGGEQALTATALIFGVFLANPAPVCVLDEVDAPLDDANVDRYCRLLNEMRSRTQTRFIVITHNPVTMSRMDRLFGVTMAERGVSSLVSVSLKQAEALVVETP